MRPPRYSGVGPGNVLCSFLYSSELIAANPMLLVGRPRTAKTLQKGLSPSSVTALLTVLEAETGGAPATGANAIAQ